MNKNTVKKIIFEVITIIVAVIIANLPIPDGLDRNGLLALAILAWAVLNWILNTMHDFIVVMIMCCVFVILKVTTFEVAFSAFSGTTYWLLLGALGLGCAIVKSGLITRLSLYCMKIMPPTFFGQTLAMFISSLFVGPLIPSTSAKVAILAPMTISIGEKLGYEKKSKGMFGIWSAMYFSFSQIAPFFISSSFLGYVTLSFLPENVSAEFTYLKWIQSMLIWGIVMYVLGFIAINLLYKPKESQKLDKTDINRMLKEMGPVSKQEKSVMAVILVCLVFWMLERTLGINASITSVMGFSVLLATGQVTPQDFNTKINWTFLTFVGGAVSLAAVLGKVGVDKWIGGILEPIMSGVTSNKLLFILTIALITIVTRVVIASVTATMTLLNIIVIPLCISAGINPWIGSIVIYTFCHQFFFKYQSPTTVGAFAAANGDETLGWGYVSKFNIVVLVVELLAVLASMPFWSLLGLM